MIPEPSLNWLVEPVLLLAGGKNEIIIEAHSRAKNHQDTGKIV